MNSLSCEILLLLASNLSEKDVPSFRLASRSFASVGIEYLIVKKHFFFRKHSLDRLTSIASHPILRRNLTEIVFFVDVVPAYDSQEAWESQARATCHTNRGRDQLAREWLRNYRFYEVVPLQRISEKQFRASGWKLQQRIRQEQETLMDADFRTFENLQRDLSMLPNLRSFSLDTFSQFHREVMRPLFILDKDQDWYCCNYNCASASFRKVAKSLINAVLTRRRTNRYPWTHLNTLTAYVTALSDTDLNKLDVTPWVSVLRDIQTLNLISVLDNRLDTHLVENPVQNPDDLLEFSNEEGSQETIESVLQQILSKTDSLHYLSLKLPSGHSFRTQQIFRGSKWSNLHYLDLVSVKIDASSFEIFLSSHINSLKQLCFFNTILSTNAAQPYTWLDFLKFMKYTLNLSEIYLGGLLREDGLNVVEFDVRATRSLASGLEINMLDLARFLVCGHYPALLKDHPHSDQEEFTSLDWQDLMAGYA